MDNWTPVVVFYDANCSREGTCYAKKKPSPIPLNLRLLMFPSTIAA